MTQRGLLQHDATESVVFQESTLWAGCLVASKSVFLQARVYTQCPNSPFRKEIVSGLRVMS